MATEARPPRCVDPVAAAYARWADVYDHMPNATRDLDARVVRDAGLPVGGADVVELGAGTGKNTAWLAAHARSVVALDLSAEMLARARARVAAGHVRWCAHDVRLPWPVPDAAADLVLANLVLEHVADVRPVLAEAARVLRPGGTLFVCELHPVRQMAGGQAHFVDPRTGETVRVPAVGHDVGDYVNAALAAGLVLRRLGEWRDDPALPFTALPRLLSLHLERPAAPSAGDGA